VRCQQNLVSWYLDAKQYILIRLIQNVTLCFSRMGNLRSAKLRYLVYYQTPVTCFVIGWSYDNRRQWIIKLTFLKKESLTQIYSTLYFCFKNPITNMNIQYIYLKKLRFYKLTWVCPHRAGWKVCLTTRWESNPRPLIF
jgi:hypothetical protein